jgi:hypothetical protein
MATLFERLRLLTSLFMGIRIQRSRYFYRSHCGSPAVTLPNMSFTLPEKSAIA